jgi:hypothetical protein
MNPKPDTSATDIESLPLRSVMDDAVEKNAITPFFSGVPFRRMTTSFNEHSTPQVSSTYEEFDYHLTQAHLKNQSFFEIIASLSFRCARPLAATAIMDLLSPHSLTTPVKTASLAQIANALKRIPVSVSPRLRMSPSKLVASSFVAPSGVLLTWMEMLREEGDAGD